MRCGGHQGVCSGGGGGHKSRQREAHVPEVDHAVCRSRAQPQPRHVVQTAHESLAAVQGVCQCYLNAVANSASQHAHRTCQALHHLCGQRRRRCNPSAAGRHDVCQVARRCCRQLPQLLLCVRHSCQSLCNRYSRHCSHQLWARHSSGLKPAAVFGRTRQADGGCVC